MTMFLLSAPAALLRFSGRKIAFFRFCRAFVRNVKNKPLGESYFPPPHNLIAIKQLQTAQTARSFTKKVDIFVFYLDLRHGDDYNKRQIISEYCCCSNKITC